MTKVARQARDATTRARPRRRSHLVALPLLAIAAFAAPAQAEVELNRNLEMNHSIDFAVLEGPGWSAGQNVRVDVFRGSTLIATKSGEFAPAAKVGGVFEVNHVGGGDCWGGVRDGRTPDVKPGDKVVATVLSETTGLDTADVDYFYVRDIAFDENPDGTISGRARGREVAGVFDIRAPINPDVEVMEAKRVLAPVESDYPFTSADLNGSGVFSNIVVGGTPGGGELFIDHLDNNGGGTGTTTTVRSADAGAGPCGPLATTTLSSVSSRVINTANVGTPLVVGGPRNAPTTVTRVTFGGRTYPAINSAETWSVTIPAADLQALAQGDHVLSAAFSDLAPNDAVTIVKDTIAPGAPSATPPPATYTTAQSVTISAEPGSAIRYTNNGATPTAASPTASGPIPVTASQTLKAIAVDGAGNPGAVGTFAYVIQAPPPLPGAAVPAGGVVLVVPASGAASTPLLSLERLALASKIKHSTARRVGIRLVLTLPTGTEVVKINIYRRSATKLKLISSRVTTRKAGRQIILQNHATLRRLLRIGGYEAQVTPGRNRTDLGNTAKRAFRVVR